MTGFRANKKFQLTDGEVQGLDRALRALEVKVLGAEVPPAERRSRYFTVADSERRRELIAAGRALHEAETRRRAAAVEYWQTIAGETRDKLADLHSGSLFSRWRRGIWWDVLTLFWIFAGAGWLAYRVTGLAAGVVLTVLASVYVIRRREGTRLASIREGEDLLRASENELRLARADAEHAAGGRAPFSASEAEKGVPDAA